METDFAPYNDEWWHFSVGDREWPAFYGLDNAVYAPVDLDITYRGWLVGGLLPRLALLLSQRLHSVRAKTSIARTKLAQKMPLKQMPHHAHYY
jgi:hypothetical protein